MTVRPIPEGYRSVTPYLVVDGCAVLIEFVKRAFDAEETFRMDGPGGTVGHAEVRIGDSMVMMADPSSFGEIEPPGRVLLHLYVEDVDKTYQKAIEAGATSMREPENQFYGDRSGGVTDPFGNQWWISTHVEDVPPDEMAKRAEEWQAQQGAAKP